MLKKNLIYLGASLVAATLWGCGSNYTSGGDQTGPDNTLANAKAVGIKNCLTCHNPYTVLIQDYLVSRHGNHMLAAGRLANDPGEVLADDPDPTTCSLKCHDPNDDGSSIDLATMQASLVANHNDAKANWTTAGPIIGCEACHGGGQFHNGIAAGIPYPVPGPSQCGKCHGATLALAETGPWGSMHTDSTGGDNVRRNILDSHYDNPATSGQAAALAPTDPLFAANVIEGYTIRTNRQTGCVDCHFNGHAFDLTKNYQWAMSRHAGEIKTLKNTALAAGAVDPATLLANVTAAGPTADSTSMPPTAFQDDDWDNTKSYGSCQVCHTSTGISNFLSDPTHYDLTGKGNDFSHLVGWKADDPTTSVDESASSGQNEMLFCWGCHADSKATVRNPGAMPLDYKHNGVQVVLPDVGDSNVCVKCHGGRGNNDSIRANSRSSRFGAHHAPTAGSLFAEQTHTAYEYTGRDYSGAPTHASIDTAGNGPCVNCHMGGDLETVPALNHTFAATEHNPADDTIITAINHVTVCESCHGVGGMTVADLQHQKDGFAAAKKVLADLLKNTVTNYLALDISTTSNNNYKTVPLDAYGAFQNSIYLKEEPCSFVHNNRYARRVIFDSIDFMQNGVLDGTINLTGSAAAAEFLNGSVPADITAVARP